MRSPMRRILITLAMVAGLVAAGPPGAFSRTPGESTRLTLRAALGQDRLIDADASGAIVARVDEATLVGHDASGRTAWHRSLGNWIPADTRCVGSCPRAVVSGSMAARLGLP